MQVRISNRIRARFALACALAIGCSASGASHESGPDAGTGGSAVSSANAGNAAVGQTAASTGGSGGRAGTAGSASRMDAATPPATNPPRTPARDAGTRVDARVAIVDDDGGTSAPIDPGRPGWKLAWSDEFDGPSGQAVDAKKWNSVNKGDGFGNNELEFYTNRTDNAALDGKGSLVITARKETYMGRMYTSARLESNGKVEYKYGRFEARIKIPRGQGIWPAFWLLGNDISSVSWPQCGEIDIMENVGKEPSIVHGTLHGPGYSGGNPIGAPYTFPNNEKVADAFHVFAVEWEENVVRFYVDDHLYETRKPSDLPANTKWVYDHPFYILLNVAVGGQWPGSPDGTTVFPQTMTVDYVRVYSR